MSFRYWNAWDVIFFNTECMRTALPRRARFTTGEALIEFTRRAGGPKTLEDRNILTLMIQKKSGEITLELTDEQYDRLKQSVTRRHPTHSPHQTGYK
jgi:hypothetical protein